MSSASAAPVRVQALAHISTSSSVRPVERDTRHSFVRRVSHLDRACPLALLRGDASTFSLPSIPAPANPPLVIFSSMRIQSSLPNVTGGLRA